jgi:hypothetical protein
VDERRTSGRPSVYEPERRDICASTLLQIGAIGKVPSSGDGHPS